MPPAGQIALFIFERARAKLSSPGSASSQHEPDKIVLFKHLNLVRCVAVHLLQNVRLSNMGGLQWPESSAFVRWLRAPLTWIMSAARPKRDGSWLRWNGAAKFPATPPKRLCSLRRFPTGFASPP